MNGPDFSSGGGSKKYNPGLMLYSPFPEHHWYHHHTLHEAGGTQNTQKCYSVEGVDSGALAWSTHDTQHSMGRLSMRL